MPGLSPGPPWGARGSRGSGSPEGPALELGVALAQHGMTQSRRLEAAPGRSVTRHCGRLWATARGWRRFPPPPPPQPLHPQITPGRVLAEALASHTPPRHSALAPHRVWGRAPEHPSPALPPPALPPPPYPLHPLPSPAPSPQPHAPSHSPRPPLSPFRTLFCTLSSFPRTPFPLPPPFYTLLSPPAASSTLSTLSFTLLQACTPPHPAALHPFAHPPPPPYLSAGPWCGCAHIAAGPGPGPGPEPGPGQCWPGPARLSHALRAPSTTQPDRGGGRGGEGLRILLGAPPPSAGTRGRGGGGGKVGGEGGGGGGGKQRSGAGLDKAISPLIVSKKSLSRGFSDTSK